MECRPPARSAAGPLAGSVTDDRRQRAKQRWPIRLASNNNYPFNGSFTRTTQKAFVHSLSILVCIILYLLTFSISRDPQRLSCEVVGSDGLFLQPHSKFLWSNSMSYIFYFVIYASFYQSFFLKECLYHLNLFCCASVIMSYVTSLSLSSLHVNLLL